MATAKTGLSGLARLVWQDLQPTPGRLAQSWRVAALCALMVLLAMNYGIPESAVSCFVIFFVMKSDAGESSVLALALVVLVSIVVLLMVPLIQVTIQYPAWRLLAMVLTSFVLLFLGVASKLGPLGGIIALVIAFVLTLLGYVPFGEIATRAVLYAWLMTCAPMGLVLIFNLCFGLYPHKVLRRELATRLRLAAQGLMGQADTQDLWDELALGVSAQQKRLGWIRLFHLRPAQEQAELDQAILNTYRALLAVAVLRDQHLDNEQATAFAQICERSAQDIEQGGLPQMDTLPELSASSSLAVQDLRDALLALSGAVSIGKADPEHGSFMVPDAFSNLVYQHHALKATAAAVLCYLIYSAADWQGIHTAMITCYVAALGSTGETVHKLALRIVGCLLGAALGFITILFVMPHLLEIGGLMVVVFLVSLVGAWVFYGPERISYAGIQIAFAFYLVTLQGFGPSFDLDSARDRVIGILLGNAVMYVMFTQIWPVSIAGSVRQRLAKASEGLRGLGTLWQERPAQAVQQSASVAQELSAAKYGLALMQLEPERLRPDQQQAQDMQSQWQDLRQQFIGEAYVPASRHQSD
ncbi:FUSC family protein [Alcaligenes faecalis]|uniref:FUSC family protein n=1 Tax=Alcaligenes faecalis TaxID=511 RepID=UPI001C83539C|nr:FUSC family protein [Alcaligenes faecalis]MBX6965926.1 FUSC family protein [Providencia rettgeri]MBX7031271.1 FUSC family protein [Alcaligenes faecalis]